MDQVARHIQSAPALAEEQKLPAGGVGDLHEKLAPGAEQIADRQQSLHWVGQMFEDVEHRDRSKRPGREREAGQRSAHRRRGVGGDRATSREARTIDPNGGYATPAEAVKKRPAAAAHVQR